MKSSSDSTDQASGGSAVGTSSGGDTKLLDLLKQIRAEVVGELASVAARVDHVERRLGEVVRLLTSAVEEHPHQTTNAASKLTDISAEKQSTSSGWSVVSLLAANL